MQTRPLIALTCSVLLIPVLLPAAGCASAGIAVRESLGQAKREQLVDRVEDARDAQEDARDQVVSTLEQLRAITGEDGGDLEKLYTRLNRELSRSESRADAVRDRIRDVERVAGALFDEWEGELDAYSDPALRRASEQQLRDTRGRYEDLADAMKRAEATLPPVLDAFGDQVLFLKHNLNARAIASLETEVTSLEREIEDLIAEMETSIAEAEAFIQSMG
ncbi:MAG: DUF2959 domain-containing protein [Planctomycetota bacterium]